ncbi:DNA-3-methyladenine glycosylase family protein [Halosimplex pelagicum]|uniref:DNA-3-methyladenine glycosylase 2 family protein n=1 Tax=Halosimplex pelagicum TaxID=869886 RepID=A0A7D5P9C6_9EURY|nr:DNA-3-methyladenine glycosylase 2 family protein [Halosimplex pelagicum]QLH84017.1 DNA-3-methyladenine glycosylase 2 family protein [Halosimplex pelagicum]
MTADPIEELAADEVLGPVIDEHGPVTIEPAEDLYERLVVSLIRQQVSMDAAAAIRERLFEAVEVSPEAMIEADHADLHDAGLSEAKADYVKSAASAFRTREWDRDTFADMGDDAVRAELTDIHGIGPWTADMFLMFGLGREDVFPVGDLGIRKGMDRLFDADMTRAEMTDAAERWRPYRSYASLYLWRAVEG